MKWNRTFQVLGLVLVLVFGVSCTALDTAPTEAPVAQAVESPSQSLGSLLGGVGEAVDGVGNTLGGAVGGVLAATDLLTCKEQKYVVTEKVIGPKGGMIKVGEHQLEIPKGALTEPTTIKAEQIPGSTNSVRFSPQGLEFERPALLTMSYKNCLVVLLPKKIVYTDENLRILELLRSIDLFQRRTVSAPIDHFSRYAVAL